MVISEVEALHLERLFKDANISFKWYTEGFDADMLVCHKLNGVFRVGNELYNAMRGGLDKDDYIVLEYNSAYKVYIMAVYVPDKVFRQSMYNAISKDLGHG